MLRGILTAAAAERIKCPDLAGCEVEYSILRAGLSDEMPQMRTKTRARANETCAIEGLKQEPQP